MPFDTPIYDAGVDERDIITTIDGAPATVEAWEAIAKKHPGDKVTLGIRRRDGVVSTGVMTLRADPTLQTTAMDSPTDAQKAFRESWLGTKVK